MNAQNKSLWIDSMYRFELARSILGHMSAVPGWVKTQQEPVDGKAIKKFLNDYDDKVIEAIDGDGYARQPSVSITPPGVSHITRTGNTSLSVYYGVFQIHSRETGRPFNESGVVYYSDDADFQNAIMCFSARDVTMYGLVLAHVPILTWDIKNRILDASCDVGDRETFDYLLDAFGVSDYCTPYSFKKGEWISKFEKCLATRISWADEEKWQFISHQKGCRMLRCVKTGKLFVIHWRDQTECMDPDIHSSEEDFLKEMNEWFGTDFKVPE